MLEIDLDELAGRRGIINDGFKLVANRQFVPDKLFTFYAAGKNLTYFGCINDEIGAGSTKFSKEEAKLACVAEFFERFFGAMPNFENTVFASFDELNARNISALDPKTLTFFADWQYELQGFPYKKLEYSDKIHWVEGVEFASNHKILLPAFAIYYIHLSESESKYLLPNTTGMAAGPSIESALNSAFLEALERHAFMDFWYNQNKNDLIVYETQTILNEYPDHAKLEILLNNPRIKLRIFDLGKFTPVETTLVIGYFKYRDKLLYSTGMASSFAKEKSIEKACLEVYQGIDLAISGFRKFQHWSSDYKKVIPEISDFEGCFHFYNAFPKLRKMSKIFKASLSKRNFDTKIQHFPNKIKSLDKIEIGKFPLLSPMYYVDLSNLKWPNFPFKVVKVFMPKVANISPNHYSPYLGSEPFSDPTDLFLQLPHFFP